MLSFEIKLKTNIINGTGHVFITILKIVLEETYLNQVSK